MYANIFMLRFTGVPLVVAPLMYMTHEHESGLKQRGVDENYLRSDYQ